MPSTGQCSVSVTDGQANMAEPAPLSSPEEPELDEDDLEPDVVHDPLTDS
jgi:hypothetical protein